MNGREGGATSLLEIEGLRIWSGSTEERHTITNGTHLAVRSGETGSSRRLEPWRVRGNTIGPCRVNAAASGQSMRSRKGRA